MKDIYKSFNVSTTAYLALDGKNPISPKFHKALGYVETETPLNYRKVLVRD